MRVWAPACSPTENDAVPDAPFQDHEPDPAPDPWIGRTLGKYKITGLLGTGGMGRVYEAHDGSLDRDVAIKILPADLAADPSIRERFMVEAKAAARLNHPNVVAIHEVDEIDDTVFIVMELVRGGTAGDYVVDHGPYDFREATRIAAEACKGMEAAHKAGLVHRDIKPANLLKKADGTIKIADFGLAKGASNKTAGLTQEGTALGTPSYMSPEQCEAKEADGRSDIYSLGATYYMLLVGEAPFDQAGSPLQVMYAHCKEDVRDPRDTNPELPPAVSGFIRRAMAKDPEKRFQNAQETREHLERVLLDPDDDAAPSAPVHEPPKDLPRTKRARRTRILQGALGAALVCCVLFVWIANRSGGALNPGATDQGVTATTIRLGTSTAFSGASRDIGLNMVEGMRAAIDATNAAGGVHGRKLELVVLDDGYEPMRAIKNMEALLGEREVFAVIGNVGTPTSRVAMPYAEEKRRLFFAPFTGARFLRKEPPSRYVFNFRASYHDETAALIRYWTQHEDVPANSIAVFAQTDSFGDDAFQGVVRALRDRGIDEADILRVGYERNTIQVADAVKALVAARDRVSAVVMAATANAAAEFVREARTAGVEARFGALSFAGARLVAERFREMGGGHGEGVIITEVVPDPSSSATGVLQYREDLQAHIPEAAPTNVSLEGYIAAQVLIEGIRRAGPRLDTETLIDALEAIRDLDLGIGPIIRFGPSDHEGSEKVWAARIEASGRAEALDIDP